MSEEYHRPTYTFPYGAYNATEERLYGKPGIIQSETGDAYVNGENYEIHVDVRKKPKAPTEDAGTSKVQEIKNRLRHKIKGFSWGIERFGIKFTSGFLLDTLGRDNLIMLASAVI